MSAYRSAVVSPTLHRMQQVTAGSVIICTEVQGGSSARSRSSSTLRCRSSSRRSSTVSIPDASPPWAKYAAMSSVSSPMALNFSICRIRATLWLS